MPPAATALAERFWPGPLTLVLRRAAGVPDAVTGGRDTVGLRVPDQPLALALLRELGDGIAAPSANRFGAVSPTTAAHVRASLGDDVDLVLDGGPCAVGVESTIVDLSDPALPRLLRSGGVSAEDARRRARRRRRSPTRPVARARDARRALRAAARVELCADGAALAARARVPRGRRRRPPGRRRRRSCRMTSSCSPDRPTPRAYAHDLYALLREADDRGLAVVLAVPPDPAGVGLAVRDRLSRAAAAG